MSYIDFAPIKARQQHRRNTEAKICHNCTFLEIKAAKPRPDGGKGHAQVCGIGRYYVRSFETCNQCEVKPVV